MFKPCVSIAIVNKCDMVCRHAQSSLWAVPDVCQIPVSDVCGLFSQCICMELHICLEGEMLETTGV